MLKFHFLYVNGVSRIFLIFGQFESYGAIRVIKTVNLTNCVEFDHFDVTAVILRQKVSTIVGLFNKVKRRIKITSEQEVNDFQHSFLDDYILDNCDLVDIMFVLSRYNTVEVLSHKAHIIKA